MKTGLMFLAALLALAIVTALPVEIVEVKLDDDTLDMSGMNSIRALERENTFEVKVRLRALEDVDNVQVEAYLRGYDHSDAVQDITDVFDMKADRTYIKTLTLSFPYRLDKDEYKLRIRVEDRNGESVYATYDIAIESQRHSMRIMDVIFSPSNAVVAGRSLLTTIRLENTGMTDPEKGVKISVTIPELGISAADYIDEIDEDDAVTSEELYLRIPSCIKGGVYEAVIKVEFHSGDRVLTATRHVTILEDELCVDDEDEAKPKTIITVGPTSQDVTAGAGGVIYPMTLSNAGTEARTYVITVDGYQSWGDVQVNPANVLVVQPGQAEAVYVFVSAKDTAAAGQYMFVLKVSSGGEVLKEFSLKANVVAGEEPQPVPGQWATIKRVLEIGLVVLVVLLVILGLIIGFSKLRGKDDAADEDNKSETYY